MKRYTISKSFDLPDDFTKSNGRDKHQCRVCPLRQLVFLEYDTDEVCLPGGCLFDNENGWKCEESILPNKIHMEEIGGIPFLLKCETQHLKKKKV